MYLHATWIRLAARPRQYGDSYLIMKKIISLKRFAEDTADDIAYIAALTKLAYNFVTDGEIAQFNAPICLHTVWHC